MNERIGPKVVLARGPHPYERRLLKRCCLRRLRRLSLALVGLILGLMLLPMPASAIAVPLPLADVASEKISQFAQAYLQVIDLIDRRENELQQAETETESQQIQAAIQSEAFDLIANHQLTVSEYLQLLGLANRDPDFREQILAQIEEVEGS